VAVSLANGGDVAGTQNDIGFDPLAPIAAKANGKPDCAVNEAINKGATSFAFQPPNCNPGSNCTGVRAIVLAVDNVDAIAVGAILYTCRVSISEDASTGDYPLRCSNALASDPDGNALAATCSDGFVGGDIFPTPTPTAAVVPPTATWTAVTATLPPTPTVTSPPTSTPTQATGAEGAVPPLVAGGRWFVDALGRVVLLHGVNMVAKIDPFYPAAFGFNDDDAAFLASEGFTAVRLGVDFRGLMPTPGVVETAYVDHLAESVATLAAHGLFVLIDFHQDGFAPMFNGNGLPDWMAISDGLPNPPDAVFPFYYIQNPAMQRAFENFWANHEGPGGVGLQDYFIQGVQAVVARFAGEPRVLGTELMNEPWPGAEWMPCALDAAGCPDLEAERLVPFYQKGAAAARQLAPSQLVFVEPFVLFNFGQADTSIPGPDERLALSFHSYALDVAGEQGVVARAVAAAERDQRPVMCTEFGASTDPVLLNRLTAEMEQGIVPWLFWAYDGEVIGDLSQPAGPDNLRNPEAFAALVRPYPIATAGTPTAVSFDPTTKSFELAYDTVGPSGEPFPGEVLTVVSVPARQYPGGYTVTADGAEVTSAPGAALLTLRTLPAAAHVSVAIAPTT
jgi:endoglycosylceramidase